MCDWFTPWSGRTGLLAYMNAVSSAVDGFPDLSPSLLLVRALSTPSHHPEPHRGNLRALCKNNMRSISCFSAIYSRFTNRSARSGGYHHGPTEAEVRAALSGSVDWTIDTLPRSVGESALSTKHQSFGTIEAPLRCRKEHFFPVKLNMMERITSVNLGGISLPLISSVTVISQVGTSHS